MKKIESFKVDHTKLCKGLYISRIDEDIITYDIRMVVPNTPPFLEVPAMHTIEHLFAVFTRNKFPRNIIYIGPMGCRTGFYLVIRNLKNEEVINLVKNCFKFIRDFSDKIPGASKKECGNFLEHDLKKAKNYAEDMCKVLENYTLEELDYNCKGK